MKKFLALTLLATSCGTLDGFDLIRPEGLLPQVPVVAASQFGNAPFVPGELVVKLKTLSSSTFNGFMRRNRLVAVRRLPIGAHVVKAPSGSNVQALAASLGRQSEVAYAHPNFIRRVPERSSRLGTRSLTEWFGFEAVDAAPNDPFYGKQYAPKITKAPEGWAVFSGDPNFILSVVDTGVDANHPDLAGKMVEGFDVVGRDNVAEDGYGHGTHCAGIAAAMTDNGVGIAGIAAQTKIMPVKVLDDNGSGTDADVAEGMIWAADHGAKVISLSLGGPESAQVLDDAVAYCLSKDVMVIAAMGNDYGRYKSYPAACPGVMAIGSTDSRDKRSSFSNYGDWISVGAPGSNIFSTLPLGKSQMGSEYGNASGTSMATPAAAGLASLVRGRHPELDHKAVRALIERSADDVGKSGFDEEFGHGRINVEKALKDVLR